MKNKIFQGLGGKVTMNNSDELFTEIANLGGVCIDRMMRSSLFLMDEIYNIGEFEAILMPSLVGDDGPSLDFWKKGKKDQKFIRVANQFLAIFRGKENVTLSDFAGLNISKSIGRYPSFPLFEFTWIGRSTEGTLKGTLKFARADLNSSNFVSYHYDSSSRKYNPYSPKKIYPESSDFDFPKNLEKVNEILGIPFKRMIDFDEEMDKIKKSSGLEGFYQALLNCT
ncbi:MAG: hypothetical protein KAI71_02680 [Candidatus Pacebacteria bacterium]|nr:hypothetical protein [Candidatus Paceibacterota bacterium]